MDSFPRLSGGVKVKKFGKGGWQNSQFVTGTARVLGSPSKGHEDGDHSISFGGSALSWKAISITIISTLSSLFLNDCLK
jgi:hypothetical protein